MDRREPALGGGLSAVMMNIGVKLVQIFPMIVVLELLAAVATDKILASFEGFLVSSLRHLKSVLLHLVLEDDLPVEPEAALEALLVEEGLRGLPSLDDIDHSARIDPGMMFENMLVDPSGYSHSTGGASFPVEVVSGHRPSFDSFAHRSSIYIRYHDEYKPSYHISVDMQFREGISSGIKLQSLPRGSNLSMVLYRHPYTRMGKRFS